MNKKNLFLAIAFVLGSGAFAFAGTPKGDAKASANDAKTEVSATPEWFHYDGAPGNEGDATQYSPISSPTCPISGTNLCEIKAQPQTADPSLPDLGTIVERRRKN